MGVRAMCLTLSVIIDDLDIHRTRRPCRPFEANPPLVIDADAVLSGPVGFQGLQFVAAQCAEVSQTLRSLQTVETRFRLSYETGEFLDVIAGGEALGLLVPVAHDHLERLPRIMNYVKHNECCNLCLDGASSILGT